MPGDPARRSAGRARLGRDREAAVRPAAVDRLRAGAGSRRHRPALSRAAARWSAARRSLSGIRRAMSGSTRCRSSTRRARASTICRGRSRSPSCSARSATTSASRRPRRSSTAGSDRSITRSRAWRRRRRFSTALNVQSIDGYDVRTQVLGMVAQHLKPGMWFKVRDEVGDGAFRRLAQKVDLELLARLAKVRLPGPRARAVQLRRDGLVSGAGASARRRAPPAGTAAARTAPAGARRETGPAGRRDPESGLRTAARRHDHDAGRSDRRGERLGSGRLLCTLA